MKIESKEIRDIISVFQEKPEHTDPSICHALSLISYQITRDISMLINMVFTENGKSLIKSTLPKIGAENTLKNLVKKLNKDTNLYFKEYTKEELQDILNMIISSIGIVNDFGNKLHNAGINIEQLEDDHYKKQRTLLRLFFTDVGEDLVSWYIYENVIKEITITKSKRKRIVSVDTPEKLFKFMYQEKEIYFRIQIKE